MVEGTITIPRILPQYLAALSAAGGAFAAGTLLGWPYYAFEKLIPDQNGFEIDENAFFWFKSSMIMGAAFVCVPIGLLINIIGRKLTMLLLGLPFTLGWCLLIWAQNVEMMYAARFILGMSGGGFCVAVPIYTAEIAQKDIRGSLGSFFHLMIMAGILFAYVMNTALGVFWTGIVCAILPLVFGAVFVFMPESPAYLVSKNNIESAIKSMQWLRGKDYDYRMEIEELKETERKIQVTPVTIGRGLMRLATIKALCICLGLMFFQQFCGINAVLYNAYVTFIDAIPGIDEKHYDIALPIVITIMQVIATCVSVMFADKLGRRVLLLASSCAMSISTIALSVYVYLMHEDMSFYEKLIWLPRWSICVFIIMFSIGFGPLPWLMMSELFASDIKCVAASIAGTFNWIFAFYVTKIYANIKDDWGIVATYWFFAGISMIGAIFVYLCVPETKGKSLNEIQDALSGKSHRNQRNVNVIEFKQY